MSAALDGAALDCAVVGAGPSGLLTALLLARAGHTVRVLERQPELTPPPGGVVLQPATLGLLGGLGLLPELLAAGTPITGVDELHDGEISFSLDYADLPDVAVPHALAVPLRVVRGGLLDAVAQQPAVTIELGATVAGIDQDPDRCVVRVSGDPERTVTARFVVGADGKHSTVRAVAGFDAEVNPFDRHQLISRIPRPDGWPSRVRSHRGDSPFVLIPSGPAFLHVFGDVDALDMAAATGELAATVAAAAPEVGELLRTAGEPVALIRHHTVAVRSWVQGRVALLGDSAHSVHPYGGQGINLGLQDAALLSRVIATATPIEDFERVRRPFVSRFQDRQRVLLGSGDARDDDSSLYRSAFTDLALGQAELRPLFR